MTKHCAHSARGAPTQFHSELCLSDPVASEAKLAPNESQSPGRAGALSQPLAAPVRSARFRTQGWRNPRHVRLNLLSPRIYAVSLGAETVDYMESYWIGWSKAVAQASAFCITRYCRGGRWCRKRVGVSSLKPRVHAALLGIKEYKGRATLSSLGSEMRA